MSSSNGYNRSGCSARTTSQSRTESERAGGPAAGRRGERGYALIAVVGIVGALAVVTLALTERARVGTSAAAAFLEETRDLYAVQAGIAAAERVLAGKPDMGKEGQLRLELTWDERQLDILITNQARKIDVNRASMQQLAEGFVAIGFAAEEATTLAARTIDWRDADDRLLPRGAEAADYFAVGLLSQPRNDWLVSLDEVGTVLGMSAEGAEELRQQFTIARALNPIASSPAQTRTVSGLQREMLDAAQSDGLTRSADDVVSARDFDVEVRVRREGAAPRL
jgi:type II secretory pathway component PulK